MKIEARTTQFMEIDADESDTWRHAKLIFAVDMCGKTYIKSQVGGYPFHFCRPFYLAGDPDGMATIYIQNCSGGVFEKDRLALSIDSYKLSHVHVTTAASTVVHSMYAGHAIQRIDINVSDGALVEYMPNMLILFPKAKMESNVKVRLAASGTVILCDSFIAYDPSASGCGFDTLTCTTSIHSAAGKLLTLDRFSISADTLYECTPGITGSLPVFGNFIVATKAVSVQDLLEKLRLELCGISGIYGGVSMLPNDLGIAVRILANDAIPLNNALNRLWCRSRECLVGSAGISRRK